MVNRAVLILKAKKPFVQWIYGLDPEDNRPGISLEEINEDRTAYLIDDLEAENLDQWIARNGENLFASELEDWSMDESYWPQNRDLKMFHKWFAVECHTVLIDIGTGPIVDDEA